MQILADLILEEVLNFSALGRISSRAPALDPAGANAAQIAPAICRTEGSHLRRSY